MIRELQAYGCEVISVHDPVAESAGQHEYGVAVRMGRLAQAEAIVAAVAHREYLEMGEEALAAAGGRRGLRRRQE